MIFGNIVSLAPRIDRMSADRSCRRELLSHSLFSLLFFVLPADFVFPASGANHADGAEIVQVSRFSGVLRQEEGSSETILRRFEATLLDHESVKFFHVLDDANAGCAWPESFGRLDVSGSPTSVQPHIVYRYDGNLYSINLPPLMVRLPDNPDVDSSWDQDIWKFTLLERMSVDGIDCWKIEAKERRGRRQDLLVEAASGTLVKAESTVFMGQGDQFELSFNRIASQRVPDETADATLELELELLDLQKTLARRPDTQLTELSLRQVEDVQARQSRIAELSKQTELMELSQRLFRDLEKQQKRHKTTTDRASKLKGEKAPEFVLNRLSGGTLDSQSLRGKTVVLHFWDYQDKPISEPYGQTGYLDFLFNQRKKANVEVIGVCVGADFLSAENLARGKRSARKLAEFMNLTYPLTWDDGSLLRALGDPRDSNGQLPLWVVLSPDGTIIHYHAGFYEIDTAKGLSDLDAVLIESIRSSRRQKPE